MKQVSKNNETNKEGLGLFLLKLIHKHFGIKKPWQN